MILTGIAIALLRFRSDLTLSQDFIYDVVLPPLIFEAALALHWSELRRDLLPVLILAILGVLVSAAVVAAGMVYGLDWPLPAALVFGVLIAATDPVAVIALFKDIGMTGRLRLLVEAESLFNDGVAAVLFALVLAWAQTTVVPIGLGGTAWLVLYAAGGGLLVGLACGGAAILVAGRTDDHLIETALTAVAAYGSFLAAEHLGASCVLATVAAGLLMGKLGVLREDERNALTGRGREFVVAFWEFTAFVANSLVFLLIGLAAGSVPFSQISPLALALSLPPGLDHRGDIVIATFDVVVFSVIVAGMTMPLMLRGLGFIE